jgi:hypothetical protein
MTYNKDNELVFEITCQNPYCELGEVINEKFQTWWNHVGHPEGKHTTEGRAIVAADLADGIMWHLDICTGPMTVKDISGKGN